MVAMSTENSSLVNRDVRILFWNMRSAADKKEELEKLLANLDVFVGVESWLKDGFDYRIPGFKTYMKNRPTRGGGILFALRSGINFVPIVTQFDVDPTVEIAAIKITGFSEVFNIFAVYRAPNVDGRPNTLSQEQWSKIASLPRNEDGFSFLMGDFNAHNIQWNCREDDINGKRFLDSLSATNLIILNTEGDTHLNVNNGTTSNIDLIIADPTAASKVVNLANYDECFGSDHFPLQLSVSLCKYVYRRSSFKLRSTRTNWIAVENILGNRFQEFFDLEFDNATPSQKYGKFFQIVADAIVENTPKSRKVNDFVHRNPVEWWDNECEKFKRLRRAAFKKWRYSSEPSDGIAYKRSCAIFKRATKKKKRVKYVKFAETIDLRKNSSYVWNKMKIFKNKWQKVNHAFTDIQGKDFRQMANEALEKLTTPLRLVQTTEFTQIHPQSNEFLDRPFTFAELNQAINSRNCSSGSGPDGIDYYSIVRLPVKYRLILLDIYNEMFESGDYPEDWKFAYVHLIKKPTNDGLRPITMTQCLCKIFEIMMKNRLQWWCENNGVISLRQSGFRKGRSAMDNVFNLTLQVQDGIKEKKDTVAAFFDIRGAFDNVVPSVLFHKLAEIGCSSKFIDFVSHLILDRKITSIINMEEPRTISKGVPQGGVLSPLLFNIYVNKVSEGVPASVSVSQFADDLAIFSTNTSLDDSLDVIQTSTDKVRCNLLDIGLELNEAKTKVLHFNNRDIHPGNVEIRVGNSKITSTDNARFLGINFDYKLSFEAHTRKIVRKTRNILNIMKFLSGVWWGADPQTLLNLYKSFVRSSIDYGLFVYWPKWKKFSNLLESVQITAIRSSLGYRCSTPKNIILEESKLLALVHRAEQQGNKFISKILANRSHSCFKSVNTFFDKHKKCKVKKRIFEKSIIRVLNFVSPLIHQTEKELAFQSEYENSFFKAPVDLESGNALAESPLINTEFQDKFGSTDLIHIYTDASKDVDQHVGWAYHVPEEATANKGAIDKFASIFTGEAVAIISALDWILLNPDKNYCIFSDSKSVLRALISVNNNRNPYITIIKNQVARIMRTSILENPVKFVWIPSHKGIEGNEIVDLLAKEATLTTINHGRIPYSDFDTIWHREAREKTFQFNIHEGDQKGVFYFHNYLILSSKPWFYDLKFTRWEIVTINRLRADHYNAAASLHRKNIIDSSNCSCGYQFQDANHILWQCSKYSVNRTELVKELTDLGYSEPFLIEHFLMLMNVKVLKTILRFIVKCNINF